MSPVKGILLLSAIFPCFYQVLAQVVVDEENTDEVVVEEEIDQDTSTIYLEYEEGNNPPVPARTANSLKIDKKKFRSPKKAMLLSLLVPGLGQAYTKKYWKTALFGSMEYFLIIFTIKHSRLGSDQLERARDYADEHYDPEKFFTFYRNFIKFFTPDSPAVDFALIFGDTLSNYETSFKGITGKAHDTKMRKDFDNLIQYDKNNSTVFVQGWDDCEPDNNSSGYIVDSSAYLYFYKGYNKDTTWLLNRYNKGDSIPIERGTFGYSLHQQEYTRIIGLSNHYYNISRSLLIFLVANHIVSAVDAVISAVSYNHMLLNKKSVWQHIDLDHQVAFTDYGFESRLDLKVRF